MDQAAYRGAPSWGVEKTQRGRLTMVFDRADMPYTRQQGLKNLGVIQDAIRYLDVRSKQTNPGVAHQAIPGQYKVAQGAQGSKRKAEDHLPEDLQLFLPNTAQKKGKYFLDLRISMPDDKAKVVAEQLREAITPLIEKGKPVEVQPDDEFMEAPKEEPKEEPHDDMAPPSPKKGRQGAQTGQ